MFKSPKPQSIEDYLTQIAGELRALPAQARADELREIESHLRAMIEERGDVAAALEQFGAPRVVGRDLRRAWERKQPEAWWLVVVSAIVGFVFQILSGLLLASFIGIASYFSLGFENDYFAVFLLFSSYVIGPIITGFSVGAVSPKRGAWIAWLYHLFIIVALLLQSFQQGFANFNNSSVSALDLFWFISGSFFLLLLSLYGVQLGARHSRRLLSRIAISIGLR